VKYKLLVVDIDGTLLGRDGSISAEDREALDGVRRSGIKVCLSTGRAAGACRSIIARLSLDGYHIFFDGALVSGLDEEVYAQPIDRGVVKEAVEFAHSHNIDLELFSATHYFAERETWSTDVHHQFFDIKPTIVDFTDLWERERIIKGGLVATTPQAVAKAEDFCCQFNERLHFSWVKSPSFPDVEFINILAPEVSKGRALEALASHLGVSLSEVVAIGDGTNDIPLFSLAGLAVAMDNAPDEVKAVAHYTTLDVDRSGLAAAVKKFLLPSD